MKVSEQQVAFFETDEYLPPEVYIPSRWYVHLPYASQITSRNLPILDGRLCHRFHDSTATDGMRRFLALECEIGERVAARFILDGDYPAWPVPRKKVSA